jgi:high-affinity nickel-transport protein
MKGPHRGDGQHHPQAPCRRQTDLAVGILFSLARWTIVFLMCVALGFGVATSNAQVQDEGSLLHRMTGIIGPVVRAFS